MGDNVLKDSYGRVIDYLRISVTDRCNLRCFYCMPAQGVSFIPCEHILRYEEILELADIFIEMGIKKIRITGGEPLIRQDIIFLIEKLGKKRLSELVLTTNGIKLGNYVLDLMNAGIKRINVSLDSLNRGTYKRITRTGKLSQVICGIKEASRLGLKVKVNVVAMRGINHEEFLDFIKFGMDNGVNIRFIEVMPQFYIEGMMSKLFLPAKDILKKIKKKYEVISNGQKGSVERLFTIRGTPFTFGLISGVSGPFCSRCNRVRLMSNGVLKACLFGKEGMNLKEMLKENRTKDEIKRAICEVVMEKPKRHLLTERKGNLVMHRVGG